MLVTYPLATLLLGALAVTAGGPIHPGAVVWGSLYGISQAIGVYWFYLAVGAGNWSCASAAEVTEISCGADKPWSWIRTTQ